ncbi:hypothetical protein IAR55_002908 [Kwoniella newhampshirensis]|uniref:Peptidase C39-like domain-containing protein n=1 Tax=Kwoniella newhampshirensis TaxID=1651941 RepID=A0AAW0Z029_9TREE
MLKLWPLLAVLGAPMLVIAVPAPDPLKRNTPLAESPANSALVQTSAALSSSSPVQISVSASSSALLSSSDILTSCASGISTPSSTSSCSVMGSDCEGSDSDPEVFTGTPAGASPNHSSDPSADPKSSNHSINSSDQEDGPGAIDNDTSETNGEAGGKNSNSTDSTSGTGSNTLSSNDTIGGSIGGYSTSTGPNRGTGGNGDTSTLDGTTNNLSSSLAVPDSATMTFTQVAGTPSATNSVSSDMPGGPLVGPGGSVNCTALVCHTGADWMLASLCGMAKCNKDWPMANIAFQQGNMSYAEELQVTTYDTNLTAHRIHVSYTNASTNANDNAPDFWLGGAYDKAVEQVKGPGVNASGLIATADLPDGQRSDAGVWGLQRLTGWYAAKEDLPEDKLLLEWLGKSMGKSSYTSSCLVQYGMTNAVSTGSPVLVLTSNASDIKLKTNQYYTVSHFDAHSNDTVVWDPYGVGEKAYTSVPWGDFRKSVANLYHLDWPHFFHTQNNGTGSQ